MYSILGRGSFCFNNCLNSAWHGGDQLCGTAEVVMEAQVSLTVAFSSSALLGLVSLIFIDSLWGSGQASLLANQAQ